MPLINKNRPWIALLIMGTITSACASSTRQSSLSDYNMVLNRYSAQNSSDYKNEETEDQLSLETEPTIQSYIAYAAAHNPGLRAAFERWNAARERIPQVTALPDPSLKWGYYLRSVETRSGPFRNSFGISQNIPWPQKLILNGEVASKQARVLLYRFADLEQDLFYQVKRIYFDLYYLRRAIELTKENLSLVKYYEKVALVRYKTVGAQHPDVIRAQVELGRLEDRLASLRDRRKPMNAMFNAVLNRPTNAAIPWPASIPTKSPIVDNSQILPQLAESNWALKALKAEEMKESQAIERAGKEYLPDLMVGFNYFDTASALGNNTPNSSEDAMVINFGMSLPIWIQKYSAGVLEAKARQSSVKDNYQSTFRKLQSSLQSALYDLRDSQRKINLYKATLIPKAEQSQRATTKSFTAGEGDFLSLIDVERTLLEFQLNYEKALVEKARSSALIARILGRPLEQQ